MEKPVIDLSDCEICEICVELCPRIFRMNKAGFVEVAEAEEYDEECVKEAAKNCPGGCISY